MLDYFLVYNIHDCKVVYITSQDVRSLVRHDEEVICIKITFADFVALKNCIKNDLYGLEELTK